MSVTAEEIKAAADRAEARAAGAMPGAKDYEFKSGGEAIADDDLGPPARVVWPEQTRNGRPIKGSMINVRKAIDELKLTMRYDNFLGRYAVEGDGLGQFVGEMDDKVVRKFRELCFYKLGYEPTKDAAYEGIQRACEERSFNSVQDQLDILVWDGEPRIHNWLTTYLGVEDTPLHRAWGELVLMAAVRRVYDPGCTFQHVLVLEGPEGANKSSVVKVLACGQADKRPLYFSDSSILNKTEKEQMELTRGVWFYEIAELAGMRRADQHTIKRFVTAEEERGRPAYAHFKENQPRIAIFIGTFNTDADTGELVEYLNPGDRRRWWPVRVGAIDIGALQRDRWQLLAEAKDKAEPCPILARDDWSPLKLDPSLWADAAEEQKEREISSPIADRFSTLYSRLLASPNVLDNGKTVTAGTDYIVTDAEVWVAAKTVVEMLPPTLVGDGRNMAAALRKLQWRQVRDRRSGVLQRGYVHDRNEGDAALAEPEPADPGADFD